MAFHTVRELRRFDKIDARDERDIGLIGVTAIDPFADYRSADGVKGIGWRFRSGQGWRLIQHAKIGGGDERRLRL